MKFCLFFVWFHFHLVVNTLMLLITEYFKLSVNILIYSILDILTMLFLGSQPVEYSPIFHSCYSTVHGRALMAVKFKFAMKNS